MPRDRLYELFARWTAGSATPQEREELEAYLADPAEETNIKEWLEEVWDGVPVEALLTAAAADRIFREVLEAAGEKASAPIYPIETAPSRRPPWRWMAAASVFLLLGVGVWL